MNHSSITLYCTEGSADKQYAVNIVPAGSDLFHVVCFNGRRGGPQKEQPKTKAPVALADAQKLYDKIVAEKKRGGYTPDESGVPYALTEKAGAVSGWLPALPTAIEAADVEQYLRSDRWCASEKYDGERRAVEIGADGIRGMNKKGLYVPVPQPWTEVLGAVPHGTILDGEQVGDVLYVFDVVQLAGVSMAQDGFAARERAMDEVERFIADAATGFVVLVRTVKGEERKRSLMRQVEEAGGEGIVLRRIDGAYRPGEASGADSAVVLKFKFVESATCIVKAANANQRSVRLCVLDAQGGEIDVGNVAIPANKDVPADGAVVEVRYLYKFEAGSLFQPFYLGLRTDQAREDAQLRKITRIKRKSVATSSEDAEASAVA